MNEEQIVKMNLYRIKANTDANNIGKALDDAGVSCDAIIAKVEAERANFAQIGETIKEQLDNFRKYIGEEQFKDIANGASLNVFLEKWKEEAQTNNANKVIDIILSFLPAGHKFTRRNVANFCHVSIFGHLADE